MATFSAIGLVRPKPPAAPYPLERLTIAGSSHSTAAVRPDLWILAFILALGALIIFINVIWDAIGLPHALQHGEVQPLPLLGLAVAVACATLLVTASLLRLFERARLGAIGLAVRRHALAHVLKGTLLGATPVALVMMLAVGAGYGALAATPPDVETLLAATAPGLAATFLLSASEELVWRGYLLRQLALAPQPQS